MQKGVGYHGYGQYFREKNEKKGNMVYVTDMFRGEEGRKEGRSVGVNRDGNVLFLCR